MNVYLSDAKWFKSRHSGADKACVEVTFLAGSGVCVRDSKNPAGPTLVFTPGDWDAFTAGIAHGAFERP
ncbi:DUF397 domain-containing protein [Nocardia beijingensis]